MMRAYYEIIASLASGPRSATYAFEFRSSGDSESQQQVSATCSWSALFGALDSYLNKLPDGPLENGVNMDGMLGEIPQELLRSLPFLSLVFSPVVFSISDSRIGKEIVKSNKVVFSSFANLELSQLQTTLPNSISLFSSYPSRLTRSIWPASSTISYCTPDKPSLSSPNAPRRKVPNPRLHPFQILLLLVMSRLLGSKRRRYLAIGGIECSFEPRNLG